jgi:hypothetical protein
MLRTTAQDFEQWLVATFEAGRSIEADRLRAAGRCFVGLEAAPSIAETDRLLETATAVGG